MELARDVADPGTVLVPGGETVTLRLDPQAAADGTQLVANTDFGYAALSFTGGIIEMLLPVGTGDPGRWRALLARANSEAKLVECVLRASQELATDVRGTADAGAAVDMMTAYAEALARCAARHRRGTHEGRAWAQQHPSSPPPGQAISDVTYRCSRPAAGAVLPGVKGRRPHLRKDGTPSRALRVEFGTRPAAASCRRVPRCGGGIPDFPDRFPSSRRW
ncbi:hypothetical protein AB0I61_32695 [Polymorphospora rubra]|uniref:hypothetical protein n=1 Tax=Polymorphospora rubra TaxID=338584 RepID=UPI0033F2D5E5